MDTVQKGFLRSSLKSFHFKMDKLVFILILCSFLDIYTVNSQHVPPPPGAKEVSIWHKIQGRDAILSCRIKDLGSRRIIWSRVADPFPLSIGRSRFNPDRKFRVRLINATTYELTIRNIELSDAGEYMCRASGAVYLADVISLNIQTGRDTTYLLPTETKIRATVGDTVLLPCNVENLNDKVVLWRNSASQVVSLRKKNLNGDRRFKVIHNTRTEWSLQIKKITSSDFGFYICIINSNPVLTRTVQLINQAPPQSAPLLKKDSHFQTKLEVMAGETVTLTCNFNSNPPSKVYWYKQVIINGKRDKEDLHAIGNTYTLQSVTPEQSAVFICYGRNGIKPPGRGRTKLIVKEPPTTTTTTTTTTTILPTGPTAAAVYALTRIVEQRRGRTAELKCLTIGQPRPNIHWTRHGKRLTNDHKYKITNDSEGRYKFYSTLTVRSLIARDFGDYECYGHNILGLKSTTFTLNELKG